MSDELIVSKLDFDQYWTWANLDRIERLMAHEVEALIDYHWEILIRALEYGTEEGKEKKDERDRAHNQ